MNKNETIQSLLFTAGLLSSELNKYLECLKPDVKFEFKGIVNDCIRSNERLLKCYEKDIDSDLRDNLSEVFGEVVETFKGKGVEKQIELLSLLKEWEEGKVVVVDDVAEFQKSEQS